MPEIITFYTDCDTLNQDVLKSFLKIAFIILHCALDNKQRGFDINIVAMPVRNIKSVGETPTLRGSRQGYRSGGVSPPFITSILGDFLDSCHTTR